MKKYLIILCFIFFNSFATGGWVTGAGLGLGFVNMNSLNNLSYNDGSYSQNGNSISTTIFAGYNFNSYIGLEINYNVIYNSQTPNFYLTTQIVGLEIIGKLPFSIISSHLKGISIFAKIGDAYTNFGFSNITSYCSNCINVSEMTFGFPFIYGAGLEYDLQNVGYRFEWMQLNLGSNFNSQITLQPNLFLLSILYNF